MWPHSFIHVIGRLKTAACGHFKIGQSKVHYSYQAF
jgi:hypothetical protein